MTGSTPSADLLRQLAGPDAVTEHRGHPPRVAPDSADQLATVCRAAHAAGWRVRVEGRGTWLPADAPADLIVSTAALDRIATIDPTDLVATVGAGVPIGELDRALAAAGAWVAIDPSGRPERSLGGVVATGGGGALRHRYGPFRDQILGCTVVTGDGRIVTAGARVTKHVAGYDLVKLHAGGFGAFGIITALHLRLRARPEADTTLICAGERDELTRIGRALEAAGLDAVVCELLAPAAAAMAAWTLGVRLMGPGAAVRDEAERIRGLAPAATWQELASDHGPAFWRGMGRSMGGGSVSLRLGVLPDGIDEALDLLDDRLDLGLVAAGAARGGIRWCGDADTDTLRSVRRTFAAREIPMTLERAPWPVRAAVGHFGAYREGVGPLVDGLRHRFDPRQILQVALDGSAGD